jgi:hypothetical protein
MTPTPWASYVTRDQELVQCYVDPQRTHLYVASGNSSRAVHTCRIRARTFELEFQPAGQAQWTPLQPYLLPLERWPRHSLPFVRVNALAIPHLIVTEQIPREPLLRAISGHGSLAGGWHVMIAQPCLLLQGLGCKQAFVMFGTHYDFAVGEL